MEVGLIGIIGGSYNTLLALKNGFDCAFTWMHNTNDTVSARLYILAYNWPTSLPLCAQHVVFDNPVSLYASLKILPKLYQHSFLANIQAMQLFHETYEFVDNEVANITLNLDTLSHQLTSLQSNLTTTVTDLNTGCDQITNTYPLFAASFDCQKIQAGLNIDTLNADIDTARNTLQEMNASIGGALNSARVELKQVELQVFDTVGSASKYLDNVYNSLFTQGVSAVSLRRVAMLCLTCG